jgi:glycosyltransferase involved in cell wall biosynthesis
MRLLDAVVGFSVGASSFFSATVLSYRYMTAFCDVWDYPLFDLDFKVSVVLPTFNEEANVLSCLGSLARQNIRVAYPEMFEVLLVDSGSEDRTVELATPYVDRVINAPRGKLTARDLGVKEARGDVIVAVDADTFYPCNFINLLLRHFRDWSVVGVGGPRLVAEPNLIGVGYVWKAFMDYLTGGRLPGSSSAFRREAYFKVGGFNLNINQFNVNEMAREEEHAFAERLKKLGRVIFDLRAVCFTSPRRWLCYSPEAGEEVKRFCMAVARKERF